jgi:anti-sigma B factor antagonist
MPGAAFTVSECDGHVVVALRGDLDVTGAAAEAAITALVARGRYLIADMSALDFLDCSALGALGRVRGLTQGGGGDVVLAAPRPMVRRLLALTGHDEALGSGQRGGRRGGYRHEAQAVPLAPACGAHCAPWEGSAVAYSDRVNAAGAAATLKGSRRGRARR